ncbi:MAG: hypothetical protein K2L49_08240, partial [Muribaculaceae bacterium]|nr:hypothetical protein [Muribaculaceae bacterium]
CLVLLSLLCDSAMSAKAGLYDRLADQLAVLVTPRDSLRVMYDMYDLAPRARRAAIGWDIFNVAGRACNREAQLDIMRNISNLYIGNDSMLAVVETNVASLPAGDDRDGTLAFVKMQRISTQARYADECERHRRVLEMLSEDMELPDNDMIRLYTLCVYLGSMTKGALYTEYMERLEAEIAKPPYDNYAIRNLYYTQAALLYSTNGDHAKSVAMDRVLLDIIDELERKYAEAGRVYRNYDVNRYNCYRRMLSNWEALSAEEIDDCYSRILVLADGNMDVARDLERSPRPRVYYLMAKGRYAEAIPYIRQELAKADTPYRTPMLRALRDASKAVGDNVSELEALSEYCADLELRDSIKSVEAYRELQIRYDVETLKKRSSRLEMERMDQRISLSRAVIATGLFVIVVLAVMLLVVWRRYRRAAGARRSFNQ